MKRSLAFGDAGRIITCGQEVEVHLPDQEDQVENATLKLYSKQHVQELIRKRTESMTSSGSVSAR